MFGSGPTNRFVAEGDPSGMRAESVWPGGMSGVLGSPFYANLLGRWLTNDTYALRANMGEVLQNLHSQQMFRPAK